MVSGLLRRDAAQAVGVDAIAGRQQLLPILLHCRDDQGRPLLGSPRSGRETEHFLRNAHLDIPAAVEAVRQYWMPIRYPRAR